MIEPGLGTQQLVQGREKSLFVLQGIGLQPPPPPCSLAGPSFSQSVECRMSKRLLPGAACLPQGLNWPAFIKSLEASEGKRCAGRYVSQPGWGWGSDDSQQPLGSLWGLQLSA